MMVYRNINEIGLAHELAHAFGLKHPFSPDAQYVFINNGGANYTPGTPESGDHGLSVQDKRVTNHIDSYSHRTPFCTWHRDWETVQQMLERLSRPSDHQGTL